MEKKDERKKIRIRPDKKERKKIWIATAILIVLLIICGQYVATKYQMSRYDIEHYACVHMSYDTEMALEDLGLRVVQRRVEHEHRWIAIEIIPNVYLEYEPTLAIFGTHLVTEDMIGEPIYQSQGFYIDGEEQVYVSVHEDIHVELTDWEEIGIQEGPPNYEFWENIP